SNLIVKMMAKKPGSRFRHPTELIAGMERVRDSLVAGKGQPPPDEEDTEPAEEEEGAGRKIKARKRKKGEKSLAPLWAAIVVVVVAVGGIAVFMGRGGGSPDRGPGEDTTPSKRTDRRSDGEPHDRGDKIPSPPPKDVEKDPAEDEFRAAESHLDANPNDYLGAAKLYRKAEKAGKGSPLGREAAKRAGALVKKAKKQGEGAFDRAMEESAAFEGEGRLGWAINVLQVFLQKPKISPDKKEKTEAEIDRLSINLLSRWTIDQGAVEDMRKRGAFDEAIGVLREVVDREKGYATRGTLRDLAEVDVDALITTLDREKLDWAARVVKDAGPRLAKLEAVWKAMLATGVPPDSRTKDALSLFARFRVLDRLCSEALADPTLAPVADRVRAWQTDISHLVSLGERNVVGFKVLAAKKARLTIEGQETSSKLVGVVEREGAVFVRFSSPPAMIPLHESLERITEEGVYKVIEATAVAGGATAGHHLALGMLLLWSTPGGIPDAVDRARTHFARAESGGLDVERYLTILEGRKAVMAGGSLKRDVDEALKLASSADKKQQALALEKLIALLAEHGDEAAVKEKTAEIEAAVAGLRSTLEPPAEVKIPFLNGEALAFDANTRAFEIRYKFAKSRELTDWVTRVHGNMADQWYQLVLDKHLGRKPVVQISGGRVNLSGGGFIVWKPRFEGDLVVEMDFTALYPKNYFFLAFATDAGGYGLHPEIDTKGLSDFARTAGMDVTSGASAGLSVVDLRWPPKIQPLKEDHLFSIRPKTWLKFRFERKGTEITAALYDRRSKLVKQFESPEETYTKGRFAVALLKSGVVFDNVLIKGTFESDWYRKTQEGFEEGERGDMPGEEPR
ncbi:MAG: hypothetical protein ACYTFG_07845, partial [Planctomycetota bacterium]